MHAAKTSLKLKNSLSEMDKVHLINKISKRHLVGYSGREQFVLLQITGASREFSERVSSVACGGTALKKPWYDMD
jgi:hypothetical protein